jgi:4-hydroxyphenylpyruvate dioxygenase
MRRHIVTGVKEQGTRSQAENGLQLKGTDYIELYVGNAHQAAHFYRMTFGFAPVAYAGPETGVRDRVSFLITQGNIRLVLTSAVDTDHAIAHHVALHGDGVKDIALSVDDAAHAFEHAVRNGARPVAEPTVFEDAQGKTITATIGVYGDTVHTFVQRAGTDGAFLPNYKAIKNPPPATPIGLTEVDHVAVCVEAGTLDQWVAFYRQVLGFHQMHEENIETEYSAMNSKAMEDASGKVKFPMMEPAPSKRKSQIEEYLSFYHGPGAQHIAALSNDIVATVRALRANGIEFRPTPDTYFDMLEQRVGRIDVDVAALREMNILVDRDQWGYLMQIFAKPVQSRPTLFCEIIQRVGARGFGSGNIKALFESIEREQALRGTL